MRKILCAFAVVIVASFSATNGVAHAGGWAVVALDPLSASPVEGRPFAVGFTILQHGVTPYTTGNAAIVVTDATGRIDRFAATPDGPAGHHVAMVTFPRAGAYRWEIMPDRFASQSLGDVEVAPAGATTTVTTTTTTTRESIALVLRVFLLVLSALVVAAISIDRQLTRRRAAA